MDAVFSNRDLVIHTLRQFLEEYRQKGPGCPQTHSATEMAKRARVVMRSLLATLQATSRVNVLLREAAKPVFRELLRRVDQQFAQMRVTTLCFLRDAPKEYEGVRHTVIDRTEAIRIFPNLPIGRLALEPVRACFEEPLHPRPGPVMGCGRDAERGSFVSRCREAGHWVRNWVWELTWISAPTQDATALWLALHRGCSVCGGVCQCETRRAMLQHAATNADLTSPLLPNHPTSLSSEPDQSIYSGLHARIRVPWDLKPIEEVYLLPMTSEPYLYNDPVMPLSTRVWMYTHPDHIVSVRFENAHDPRAARPKMTIDWSGTYHVPSTSIEAPIHLELVLSRIKNVKVGAVPFANALLARLYDARLASLQTSGLRDEITKRCPNWHGRYAQTVLNWTTSFDASLPLFPAHGRPREHSWMHAFGFTEREFLDASWQATLPLPPSATNLAEVITVEEAEEWREKKMVRILTALSEALPNRHTAFYREIELNEPVAWYDGPGRENPNRETPAMIQVQDLCIHALDQLLAAAHPGLCADNWELLKTWEPLDALRHRIVDKGEAFQTLLRLYQEPPEWHYQRLPADPAMIAHFSRLDSVLGLAWKHVARMEDESYHRQPSAPSTRQTELLKCALAYLDKTKTTEPPSPWDTPVFGGRPPPGPRHPDVLMRWWLAALTNPKFVFTSNDPASAAHMYISLHHHNTFVGIDSRNSRAPKAPQCDPIEIDILAVHISLNVTTHDRFDPTKPDDRRDRHLRLPMGIRLKRLIEMRHALTMEPGVDIESALAAAAEQTTRWRSLSEWHEEANQCCDLITRCVHKGGLEDSLWLLQSIAGSIWTPVLPPAKQLPPFKGKYHNWAEGWTTLSNLCTPTSAWFCNVHGPVPFCKWRGHHHCTCQRQCCVD